MVQSEEGCQYGYWAGILQGSEEGKTPSTYLVFFHTVFSFKKNYTPA